MKSVNRAIPIQTQQQQHKHSIRIKQSRNEQSFGQHELQQNIEGDQVPRKAPASL
jgi:hypothetical protein